MELRTFDHLRLSPFLPLERSPRYVLAQSLPSASRSQQWKRWTTGYALRGALDRVNVLGDSRHGHTGCVNALSWAQDGELLITGGDDTTIRVWRMDLTIESDKEYPFTCQSVIHTGHRGNIFNAQMLPFSTRIASVAWDKEVRVFDVGESVGRSSTGNETSYTTRESCIRVLCCHSKRTKRIVTEESPDLFLTVAEDGQVRQHDLRTPHSCASREQCPAPLVKLPHDLSTLTLSPLTPYQFVVGGKSPYAYLFDRRHAGRFLQEEWGMLPRAEDVTTCVRRFGRRSRAQGEERGTEHITGAKMSAWNGHELLLSYSRDAVCLYSTRDEPVAEMEKTPSMVPSNQSKRGVSSRSSSGSAASIPMVQGAPMVNVAEDLAAIFSTRSEDIITDDEGDDENDDENTDEENDEMNLEESEEERTIFDCVAHKNAPVIYPRLRFEGHSNVETVKDVNFLGPHDEYVTSGSDDGNLFIWQKSDGKLVDILEGDSSVVNVIEGHPHLPLFAVSGIDTTIKLFAPVHRERSFSRLHNAESIKARNAVAIRRIARQPFTQFLITYDRALRLLAERGGGQGDEDLVAQCPNQ